MGLLEWKQLEKYNYKESRMNVDVFMEEFHELYFKYMSITPRSLTSRLKEVVTDYSKSTTSYIEEYVERKDEYERKYLSKLDLIVSVLDNMNFQEQIYFKGIYMNDLSESTIRDKLQISRCGLDHVKQSAIIKFSLAFGLDELKEERKW